MIEIILMFLMRMIAAAMEKHFVINTVKNITYVFNKEQLHEPTYVDMV